MDPNGSDLKERINNYVAVSVAILAAFMAVTKVKDDNVCQVMVKEAALLPLGIITRSELSRPDTVKSLREAYQLESCQALLPIENRSVR